MNAASSPRVGATLQLRIPPEVKEQLARLAFVEKRTISAILRELAQKAIDEHRGACSRENCAACKGGER